MKKITLKEMENFVEVFIPDSNGKSTLINLEDLDKFGENKYGVYDGYIKTKNRQVPLANIILGTDRKVDHINRNSLDNRRCNLRKSSSSQNSCNQKKRKDNTTGMIGVTRNKGKFQARIDKNKKPFHIGTFETKEEAALAYNKKAIELHGDFAKLNKINSSSKLYVEFLKKYLSSDVDALLWATAYAIFCHGIDDIIDKELDKDDIKRKVNVVQTFGLAQSLYSNHFYIKNMHLLFPIIRMGENAYIDSLHFEGSKQQWKINYSDILRSQASDVILMIIEIVCGVEKRKEASLELRAITYYINHDSSGNPI